ncbi:MAG: nickel pincer cofactor biosynthesis protein LarB [Coriobacteriia bacterium]|nr:nickel pincer cofactor biosynthesis protein LarB [Coriobacteriia bacterium]
MQELRIDHERQERCGFPEVVFAQGKTVAQIVAATTEIYAHSGRVLVTRATPEDFEAVRAQLPEARYHEQARIIAAPAGVAEPAQPAGLIVVAAAGTADIPVAEEAAVTAEAHGACVQRLYDIGIAGVHRALEHVDELRAARVIIAVAGMEGALPSLIAGLVSVPVIAVPTSVGYGAHLQGLAPLLTMLNSCAGGIGVVNIDNGYGAAELACRINDPSWA